jgi:hypothetical protein
MIAIRHNILGTNNDNRFSLKELLRNSCGKTTLHVPFTVNHNG